MSQDCFRINALPIAGTRQDGRMYEGLNPAYVVPDERSIADIMVFIHGFAKLINFYTIPENGQKEYLIDGTWQPLILSDEAFNYAEISVIQKALPNVTFHKYVGLYETGSTAAKRFAAYRVMWDILFSVYRDIQGFYRNIPVSMPLHGEIFTEIINTLMENFCIAANAYLHAPGFIPAVSLHSETSAQGDEYAFGHAKSIIESGFDTIWIDESFAPGVNNWPGYLAALNANPAPAQEFFHTATLLSSEADMVDYSTLHLKQLFKMAFEAYARIITKADAFLRNSIEKNASHFAHHGLLLAFLKLFEALRNDINTFTQKHLEYYYSRVLRITPGPATPDSMHVLFDPARHVQSHLIEQGVRLLTRKDNSGKPLFYTTDEPLVINQARVAQLKSLYLEPADQNGTLANIYANTVADSSDGMGGEFTGEDLSWPGFGSTQNKATLGFMLAAPVLHLTEGTRTVEFVFTSDNEGVARMSALTQSDLIGLLKVSYSGEEQWESLIMDDGSGAEYNCKLQYNPPSTGSTTFTITLVLQPQCNPVTGYDPQVCEGDIGTRFPVFRFVLNQEMAQAYEKLRDIPITSVHIKVAVSGLSGLTIQNDLGALDPTKPFQPFGPAPRVGSGCYIGHCELAHKQVNTLSLKLHWQGYKQDLKSHYGYKVPDGNSTKTHYYVSGITNNDSFKAAAHLIRNKTWIELDAAASFFQNGPDTDLSFSIGSLERSREIPESFQAEQVIYTPQTQNGFIRLRLNAPVDAFGHETWPPVFAQQTVAYTQNPGQNSIPKPPYIPVLQGIELSYQAEQTISPGAEIDGQGYFMHLEPFGVQYPREGMHLLPGFTRQVRDADGSVREVRFESALLIGIEKAVIRQTISMLIQVHSGTENISIDPPSVTWNYLSGSGWKHFNNALISDTTDHLRTSGIVRFEVPADIDLATTELPGGYVWVCAFIESVFAAFPKISAFGLPRILLVKSNAVKATFSDQGNDPDHLSQALPAGTISRLYESDAAVKKVFQPFASFGGRKSEHRDRFYTRVSERLRHKSRAVTIWDHERLVLDAFPEVYMVKCLNHTGYDQNCKTGHKVYRENLPGKVMLVPVPYLTLLHAGNIYQPALSAAKISEITNFIRGELSDDLCRKYRKPLSCLFAELTVENPKYETIKVQCKVRIKPCLDQTYYEGKLIEDLNIFLSPWISGDSAKIIFGGKLHISQVVYFIEQRPYIDFVEHLTIEHRDGDTILNTIEPTLAVATTSRSVLTSFGTHHILQA